MIVWALGMCVRMQLTCIICQKSPIAKWQDIIIIITIIARNTLLFLCAMTNIIFMHTFVCDPWSLLPSISHSIENDAIVIMWWCFIFARCYGRWAQNQLFVVVQLLWGFKWIFRIFSSVLEKYKNEQFRFCNKKAGHCKIIFFFAGIGFNCRYIQAIQYYNNIMQ